MPADRPARSVTLPVLPGDAAARAVRPSRMGRWRALVLVLVHVVIAVHVVQWLVTGMTVSPVEPSESMETLERGVVNAGFVFFALAIASTLVFGRFFCGWGCHVVALQDLCGHLMRRAGVRPKPFRSRLLVFVPLVFGLYMFGWPSFKRLAIRPALEALGAGYPVWLADVEDPHRLTSGFLVSDFWATFPPWYVAIPFFAVCGFACVYFLGSKGFCTYGCPYGGLFGPADVVAPVRIRVTDACEGCGHCTATCTSNVRVHEEVRDFGMVVDPGCMKCMDCVSVCPNDALYVGLGRPALLAGPRSEEARTTRERAKAARRRRYDLSTAEEVVFAGLFAGLFLAFRGMLDLVPMLMAIGMAGVGTFLLYSAWRVLRVPSVRIQGVQLKLKGAVRPAGVAVLAIAAVIVASAAWSGHARAQRWLAGMDYKRLEVPAETVLRAEFVPTSRDRRTAERGLAHARLADAPARGGLGWSLDPDALVRVAYMSLLAGRDADAEEALRRVVDVGRPLDPVVFQLATVMRRRGADEAEIAATLEHALGRHPRLVGVRSALAQRDLAEGRPADAEALWQQAIEPSDASLETLVGAARFYGATGRPERAAALLDRARSQPHATRRERADDLLVVAGTRAGLGDAGVARALIDEARTLAPHDGPLAMRGAMLAARLGDPVLARSLVDASLDEPSVPASRLADAATVLVLIGDAPGARAKLLEAADGVDADAWALASLASRLRDLGLGTGDPGVLADAIELSRRSVALRPSSPTLHHDLAFVLFAAGRDDEAIGAMERACELAPESPEFPDRLATMLVKLGRPEEASRWRAEADRRRGRGAQPLDPARSPEGP